ncbi:MAG: hypothetical protein F4Y79_15740 [Gemmatimonadetes bacterium]|nr:hypothetical protein [Gemmatimonadota bacterium]MYF17525.1 hypothetical protein [Gemmatimonadota bacterium]
MKRYLIAIFVIIATLWCDAFANTQEKQEESPPAFVDENGDGIDDRVTFRHRQGLRSRGSALLWVLSAQLTKAQRTTLQARINELLAEEATPREIRRAIFAELEGFGVDLTETFLTRLNAVLTEDQMSALRKKAEALKANGATYYRIYREIRDELAVMGINWEGQRPDYSGSQLTEGEMSDLQKKIDKLIADGASRVEIQKAIHVELEEIKRRNRRRSRTAGDRGGPPPRSPERERSGKQGN